MPANSTRLPHYGTYAMKNERVLIMCFCYMLHLMQAHSAVGVSLSQIKGVGAEQTKFQRSAESCQVYFLLTTSRLPKCHASSNNRCTSGNTNSHGQNIISATGLNRVSHSFSLSRSLVLTQALVLTRAHIGCFEKIVHS